MGLVPKGVRGLIVILIWPWPFNAFPSDLQEERLQPELLSQDWADALGLADEYISVVDINHIPIQLTMSIIEFGQPIQVNNATRLIPERTALPLCGS